MKVELSQNLNTQILDKNTLYAKYFLGQISAGQLAEKLKVLNSIEAHYEIKAAKKNLLSITYFKDVPTDKPGEQLAQTVTDIKPVTSISEARRLLETETCVEKVRELQNYLDKQRTQILHNKVNLIIFLQNVIQDINLKAQSTLTSIRLRIKEGLKFIREGSFKFTNFKALSKYIVARVKAILSMSHKKIRFKRLGQTTTHVKDNVSNISKK